MEIIETSQYLRTKKQLIKKHALSKHEIDNALKYFEKDPYHASLHYKKMTCKKDKERYSIRIPNTQYRILMNVYSDTVYVVMMNMTEEIRVVSKII